MSHITCRGTIVPAWTQTFWIVGSVIVFTLSWKYIGGGYLCSVPLTLLLLVYTVTQFESKADAIATLRKWWKEKLTVPEKRPLILVTLYWSFRIVVSLWYPYMESSNGSPYSLIFFSIVFCILYIAPTILGLLVLPLSTLLKWEDGIFYGNQSKKDIMAVLHIIWEQWLIILVISVFVIIMFVFDGDVTVFIRYVIKGKPCWPLLIPRTLHYNLPYPLKHSWMKWSNVFVGYAPGKIQFFVQNLGRELGEVSSLLPVIIGVYVASQLVLHSKHNVLRITIFSCMAGVVIGGICSALFKVTLHRYRPNAYGDPYKWTGPGTAVVNHLAFSKLDLSFPAGHTTITSAVATCLFYGLLESRKKCSIIWKSSMGILLYMFPMVVLISRVSDCYHWNSDASFGVCLFPTIIAA